MFALQNFEVRGSVLVEKMHTPETKKYHFSKNSPAMFYFILCNEQFETICQ